MAEIRLDMTFLRADGNNSKISVDNAKSNLTETEVNTAMDSIISKVIFEPNGSPIVEKVKAELVTTEVSEFNMV